MTGFINFIILAVVFAIISSLLFLLLRINKHLAYCTVSLVVAGAIYFLSANWGNLDGKFFYIFLLACVVLQIPLFLKWLDNPTSRQKKWFWEDN